jgi:hypothetical protein
MIWYPAAAVAREEPQRVGPFLVPFFSAGSAARDAAPLAGPAHGVDRDAVHAETIRLAIDFFTATLR